MHSIQKILNEYFRDAKFRRSIDHAFVEAISYATLQARRRPKLAFSETLTRLVAAWSIASNIRNHKADEFPSSIEELLTVSEQEQFVMQCLRFGTFLDLYQKFEMWPLFLASLSVFIIKIMEIFSKEVVLTARDLAVGVLGAAKFKLKTRKSLRVWASDLQASIESKNASSITECITELFDYPS